MAASLAVLGLAFLPWVTSGDATRTSFEVVRSAERLDVLTGAGRTVALSWYLLPALVALVWLAAALGRPLVVGVLGALVGAMAIAMAIAVKMAPVEADTASSVAIAAGAVALGGAWTIARRQRGRAA